MYLSDLITMNMRHQHLLKLLLHQRPNHLRKHVLRRCILCSGLVFWWLCLRFWLLKLRNQVLELKLSLVLLNELIDPIRLKLVVLDQEPCNDI